MLVWLWKPIAKSNLMASRTLAVESKFWPWRCKSNGTIKATIIWWCKKKQWVPDKLPLEKPMVNITTNGNRVRVLLIISNPCQIIENCDSCRTIKEENSTIPWYKMVMMYSPGKSLRKRKLACDVYPLYPRFAWGILYLPMCLIGHVFHVVFGRHIHLLCSSGFSNWPFTNTWTNARAMADMEKKHAKNMGKSPINGGF